jgi:hypothetical protein
MSQKGNAGRDLIQVGRDYVQYIYNNSRTGHWGKVAVALIPLFLFLYGAREVGINVVETFTPTSSEDSAAIALPTQNPINVEPEQNTDPQASEFQFPQDSCGDKSTNANNTWYPVFIGDRSLDEIRQEFCRDAIPATRQAGERSVQVASFISLDKAQRFAVVVGGEVGEPRKLSPAVSSQPRSNSGEQPESASQSQISSGEICSTLPCSIDAGELRLTIEKVENYGGRMLDFHLRAENLSGGMLQLNDSNTGTYAIDDSNAQSSKVLGYNWNSQSLENQGVWTRGSTTLFLTNSNTSTVFVHFNEIVPGVKIVMGIPMRLTLTK